MSAAPIRPYVERPAAWRVREGDAVSVSDATGAFVRGTITRVIIGSRHTWADVRFASGTRQLSETWLWSDAQVVEATGGKYPE